jgi:lysophospholipase L1-like esterase
MSHTTRHGAAFTAVVTLALALISPAQGASGASQRHHPLDTEGWYLQLGDSLAAGHQPTIGDDPTGGYADNALAAVDKHTPGTRLLNLACSGETTVTMIDGGRCTYDDDNSQLDQAVSFLTTGIDTARTNADITRAITLSMGANDVLPGIPACLQVACLGLDAVGARLTQILTTLHEAAPDVPIVVLNYYNPFLGMLNTSGTGTALAVASVPLHAALIGTIATSASSVGAEVADIATAFHTEDGTIEAAAQHICNWTWMCSTMVDIHANTTGYDVMGRAVAAKLSSSMSNNHSVVGRRPSPTSGHAAGA